jgi:uncharacterized protein YdiU (UPF0061 family)
MFKLMQASHVDFTLFFRRLGDLRADVRPGSGRAAARPVHRPPGLRRLGRALPRAPAPGTQRRCRTRRLAMHKVNPKYILRNYLAQVAIEKAHKRRLSEVSKLLAVLERPFDEQPENEPMRPCRRTGRATSK